jgi:hypothetical protein
VTAEAAQSGGERGYRGCGYAGAMAQKRRCRWGRAVLAAFAVVYLASLRWSVMLTPLPSTSMGVANGALVIAIRKPMTAAEAKPFGLPSNVPRPLDVQRTTGGPTLWFRGLASLRHYFRNDPDPRLGAGDWMQAGDVTVGVSRGVFHISSTPPVPATTILPGPGVAPWLPLSAEVPLWALLVLISLPWMVVQRVRRWRKSTGHCAFCGYDLRATAGVVCPECGEATLTPVAARGG